ncbi:hypothetical protein GUJ93_ZPchr0013g34418 [Zizania palustris]|uniref:HTH myb-type domain-containing protein n=1 Tax=Zizania palustris TaxID=103762 RepID=A0A8J5WWM5_ZIZPA|nr:hypothetical protein GUJ93_ZPchr0013g34418 [Zizania palustris]
MGKQGTKALDAKHLTAHNRAMLKNQAAISWNRTYAAPICSYQNTGVVDETWSTQGTATGIIRRKSASRRLFKEQRKCCCRVGTFTFTLCKTLHNSSSGCLQSKELTLRPPEMHAVETRISSQLWISSRNPAEEAGKCTDKAAEDLISTDKCATYKQTFRYMTGTEQMYHQQQQQPSSMPGLAPEKQFLLQAGADSGLILSTDAKPRLKWTSELHERFVEAIHQLGGPDKATPKTIMRLMGIPGLTLYHLKSHLQKYRLSKNLQAQANASCTQSMLGCTIETDKPCEGNGSPASHLDLETQTNSSLQINEALQMQIEVQRRLHEQLEVQRHLQLRIEAQGKYLQSVLERAQEALGTIGVEAAKRPQNEHSVSQQLGDGSVDSCLTACEASHSHCHRGGGGGDQDNILSIGLPFEPAARSGGKDVRGASSRFEHYLFPDEPSRRSACSDERREIRRDGFNRSITLQASDLDLNIDDGSSRSRTRENIDLNGSGWN